MPPHDVSARFFLQLATGLLWTVPLVDRARIGKGFVRLMALCSLGCLIPALLLLPGTPERTILWLPSSAVLAALAVVLCLLVVIAGRRAAGPCLWSACVLGGIAVVELAARACPSPAASRMALAGLGGLSSASVLGGVTGAMILGHWYLVTPDLPVAELGRVTRFSLVALYLKAVLLALTLVLFTDQFSAAWEGGKTLLGVASGSAPFQDQLDLVYLLARLLIGLVGPAVLCHMTLKTVQLGATQPATGILYAATILVLMGELFACLGEASFEVVL